MNFGEAMNIKRVLLVYKKSAYEIYFLGKKSSFQYSSRRLESADLAPFKSAHQEHYKTLKHIELILKKRGIHYQRCRRASKTDYSPYDLIISVGGDGTFLEAARGIKRQLILGVNSDPQRSVGRFCAATRENFVKVLDDFLKGKIKINKVRRLRLRIKNPGVDINATNDILICHRNPAAMSRYVISFNGIEEKHCSSGVWIATAAGSSGAIKSAGGKALAMDAAKMQFLSRELYEKRGYNYRLKNGMMNPNGLIQIKSLMRNGMIYVDGTHVRFPFYFGEMAVISGSQNILRVVHR